MSYKKAFFVICTLFLTAHVSASSRLIWRATKSAALIATGFGLGITESVYAPRLDPHELSPALSAKITERAVAHIKAATNRLKEQGNTNK